MLRILLLVGALVGISFSASAKDAYEPVSIITTIQDTADIDPTTQATDLAGRVIVSMDIEYLLDGGVEGCRFFVQRDGLAEGATSNVVYWHTTFQSGSVNHTFNPPVKIDSPVTAGARALAGTGECRVLTIYHTRSK